MAGARTFYWNGTDLPAELRELPAGTYVVEAVDGAHALTADEEDGLRGAMASLRAGQRRSVEQVRQTIDALLRR